MSTLLIDLNTTLPQFNLAAEEYFLKKDDKDKLIFWQNEPSIIIGRNQNTLSEVNKEAADALGVHIVRRMSGGGAVFHDLGNLNYTFITKNDGNDFLNFKKFTDPVVKALQSLGVNASLSGRNDLLIDGLKFSGNAQYIYKDMLLHHGTLMFSSNLDVLEKVLNVKEIKIKSKGIASVKSRVTNISKYSDVSIDQFKQLVFENTAGGINYAVTDEDRAEIEKLQTTKYDTWDWNFGFSPKYSFHNEGRFPCGIVELDMEIRGGTVQEIKFSGDFFGKKDVSDLEEALKGVRHDSGEISSRLNSFNIGDYFSQMNICDLVSLF